MPTEVLARTDDGIDSQRPAGSLGPSFVAWITELGPAAGRTHRAGEPEPRFALTAKEIRFHAKRRVINTLLRRK